MLRKNAKVELIRRVPLFSHCSRRELEGVAAVSDEVDLPAGRVLMREGERGRELFVVVEGAVEVRRGRRLIRSLGPGDFVGEIALVSRKPRIATVTATTPVRALVISDQSFRSLLADSPDLQLKVMSALAERVAETIL